MATAKLPKKQQEILSHLNSTEEILIQKGLVELKASGAEEIIPDVLNIFINADEPILIEGLKNILFEIKSQKAVDHIFETLKKDKSKPHRPFLVSILWQAGLDATDYLSELVEIAIENDFMTCLECLTVIENFETEFCEDEILKNLAALKEATMIKNDKTDLLLALHEVVQSFIIG